MAAKRPRARIRLERTARNPCAIEASLARHANTAAPIYSAKFLQRLRLCLLSPTLKSAAKVNDTGTWRSVETQGREANRTIPGRSAKRATNAVPIGDVRRREVLRSARRDEQSAPPARDAPATQTGGLRTAAHDSRTARCRMSPRSTNCRQRRHGSSRHPLRGCRLQPIAPARRSARV